MFLLFLCDFTIIRWRHAIGIAKDAEERTAGEAGELGNDGHGICCGCQQTCGIAQTVLIEEAVHTFTIGTGTDGIGHVMFIGAEEKNLYKK